MNETGISGRTVCSVFSELNFKTGRETGYKTGYFKNNRNILIT